MAYQVINAYGSVISINSSLLSGGETQNVAISSFLTALPITLTGNPSISGTVILGGGQTSVSGVGIFNTNPIGNGSVFAVLRDSSVAALQGTNPWVVHGSIAVMSAVPHSVATLQGTNPWVVGNSSVMLTQGINTIGSVATVQGTNPWTISNSSVYLTPGIGVLGSVATLQGTSPWITTVQNNSIAGTYPEDTAHVDGHRGIFTLGVRNDAVASFASANLDYTPRATDSQGRTLVKVAPEEARIQSVIAATAGNTSFLAAAGAGLRTYITDAFVTNTSSNATLVTFQDQDNSVMGRTIAPATGGSNMVSLATPMRTGGFNQTVSIVMTPITSTLGVTALGYRAP